MSKGAYVREATGLTRELTALDTSIGNLSWMATGVSIAGTAFWAWYALPGGDFLTGLIIGGALLIPTQVVFAFLSAAMPRAGGDYIFVSRLIHPAVGFANNLAWVILQLVYGSLSVTWLAFDLGTGPFLRIAGIFYNNPAFAAMADALAQPMTKAMGGVVLTVILGIIACLGTKRMYLLTDVFYMLGTIGLLCGLGVMATMSHQSFVAIFNERMMPFQPNAYEYVMTTADKLGFTGSGYNFTNSIGILPLSMFASMYSAVSLYALGEIKSARSLRRVQLPTLVYTTIINQALIVIWVYLMLDRVGMDFLNRFLFLSFDHPEANPLPISYPHVLVSLVSPSPIVGLIIAGSITLYVVPYMLMVFVMATRCFFAYSFDRVLPAALADVNPRVHAPIKATILATVVIAAGCFMVLLNAFYYFQTAGLPPQIIVYIVILLAAAVLPYKAPELYKKSPIQFSVGGVPLITVLAGIAIVIQVAVLGILLNFPKLMYITPEGWGFIAALFLVPVVLYYLAAYARKTQGIDISLAFKELPPE